eukprot:759821-Hanusia_phi.AAC.1
MEERVELTERMGADVICRSAPVGNVCERQVSKRRGRGYERREKREKMSLMHKGGAVGEGGEEEQRWGEEEQWRMVDKSDVKG